MRHSCKGLPPKKPHARALQRDNRRIGAAFRYIGTCPAAGALRIFFRGTLVALAALLHDERGEVQTSTMLTGVTAPPKGGVRPYLPMTARTTFPGGSAERLGACPVPCVCRAAVLRMPPLGGAVPGNPYLPKALPGPKENGAKRRAEGAGLCLVPSGSHFPLIVGYAGSCLVGKPASGRICCMIRIGSLSHLVQFPTGVCCQVSVYDGQL